MRIIVFDAESFYAPAVKDDRGIPYSLSHRPTEDYVRHPWFKMHGAAIKWRPQDKAVWYDEPKLRWILKNEDWSDVFLISHHQQFDGLALAHHYDVHPKFLGCTLAMSRLWLGNHIGVSLDSVRSQFDIPAKKTPYNLFVGRHWNEMSREVQEQVAEGACDEVESVWKIFCSLLEQGFPKSQLRVIDILLRMFVEPRLIGDTNFFARVWEDEAKKKNELFNTLGITEADLQSADKFAGLLRDQGVEPAVKPGKNGDIYAFAKSDPFMDELQESDDPIVANLAAARLGAKSTITHTRAERLGWMSRNGPLCVYIRPYGARTTRPAGGDKSNFLNMKKPDPDMPKVEQVTLKQGMSAPSGFKLAPIDSSQIECRLLNYVAGQWDVIDRFRNGEDPYVTVASQFYGYPINKKDHPTERQCGKVLELQAGYGSGGPKLRTTLRVKAGILISEADGLKARDAYRNTHSEVVALWKQGNEMIRVLANGGQADWGPVKIRDKRMWLPNGSPLIYDTLESAFDEEKNERYWRVKTRKGWDKLYGAKLVENMIQALAWNFVSDIMVRLDGMGYRSLNCPYDELLLLIPDDGKAESHLERCKAEFRKPPAWLSDLPLDVEGELGDRYAY